MNTVVEPRVGRMGGSCARLSLYSARSKVETAIGTGIEVKVLVGSPESIDHTGRCVGGPVSFKRSVSTKRVTGNG